MSDMDARHIVVGCIVAVSAALVVGVVIKSKNDTAFVAQATEQTALQGGIETDLRHIAIVLGSR